MLDKGSTAHLVTAVPCVLRLLSAVMLALGVLNARLLYGAEPALGVLYAASAVLLRLLIWCAEYFRGKWLVQTLNGEGMSVVRLLAEFSLTDVFRAVLLFATVRAVVLVRSAVFLAVPVVCFAFSLACMRAGVSAVVLSVLVLGNLLIFFVAVVFCRAAVGTVCSAASLSCTQSRGVITSFRRRLARLDEKGFSLLRVALASGRPLSPHRELSRLIYTKQLLEARVKSRVNHG